MDSLTSGRHEDIHSCIKDTEKDPINRKVFLGLVSSSGVSSFTLWWRDKGFTRKRAVCADFGFPLATTVSIISPYSPSVVLQKKRGMNNR